MRRIPPSFCCFDHLCAVHHQQVLHPQKETHIFFAPGCRRGKHQRKRETSSHRWTKDAGVSNARIWRSSFYFTATMIKYRWKSRSLHVAVLEGIPYGFEELHAGDPATVSPLLV